MAAFATVYLVWGSTYLAIRLAIETLPPFLMAGTRFLIAGACLLGWVRLVSGERVTRNLWKPAAIMGAFLLLGGNGAVVWAEQYVPSGITALLVGATPFWMALLNWLWLKAPRPSGRIALGLLIGFAGLIVLIGPSNMTGVTHEVHLLGALAILGAALSWSVGSLYSKKHPEKASPMMMASLQMLAGGTWLFLLGLVRGEWHGFDWASVSDKSWWAFLYLTFFGSLVGFTSYIYVLRHSRPALASTYAYVNPLVAVLLGWAIADEIVTWTTAGAGAMIVAAVVLITLPEREAKQV